jgi:microsomal dipeptidase-like Zn-dependent dipeptidase
MQVPRGVRAPDQIDALDAGLAEAGWSDDDRESFAWRAWDRILRATCLA